MMDSIDIAVKKRKQRRWILGASILALCTVGFLLFSVRGVLRLPSDLRGVEGGRIWATLWVGTMFDKSPHVAACSVEHDLIMMPRFYGSGVMVELLYPGFYPTATRYRERYQELPVVRVDAASENSPHMRFEASNGVWRIEESGPEFRFELTELSEHGVDVKRIHAPPGWLISQVPSAAPRGRKYFFFEDLRSLTPTFQPRLDPGRGSHFVFKKRDGSRGGRFMLDGRGTSGGEPFVSLRYTYGADWRFPAHPDEADYHPMWDSGR